VGAPLEAGKPRLLAICDAAKERLTGLVEASQHVVPDAAVEGGVRRERRPESLQLGLLVGAREGDVAALPGGAALCQGGVGERAAAPEHLLQRPRLARCRTQLLHVGFASRWLVHREQFCLIGTRLARARAITLLPLPLQWCGVRLAKALICQRRPAVRGSGSVSTFAVLFGMLSAGASISREHIRERGGAEWTPRRTQTGL
jgi:hypothetical protein